MNAPTPGRARLVLSAVGLLAITPFFAHCGKDSPHGRYKMAAPAAAAYAPTETYEVHVEEKEQLEAPAPDQPCEDGDKSIAGKDLKAPTGPAERPFVDAAKDPMSTVSIDVDTASYSLVRNTILRERRAPMPHIVRIEELLNYFDYNYPGPKGDVPFAVHTDVAAAPWAPGHDIVRIGIQGRRIAAHDLPPSNLVFLLDVSGSMNDPNKLPLLKASMGELTKRLRHQDRVAIVVYAGAAGIVLPSTPGTDRGRILAALSRLESGGSTAGAAGIELAYKVAKDNYIEGGNNRVVLATDGDFNVGPSSRADLVNLISRHRKSNVFLSVLGFGMGNYRDGNMQELADRGNGNHAYIDSLQEARKVLARQMGGTLHTIAKDVKVQVRFDPKQVKRWRLIGYDNRVLAHRDFDDDTKDAGELGAGHSVTYLYEIERVGPTHGDVDKTLDAKLLNVRLRYKTPEGAVSKLIEAAATPQRAGAATSRGMQWALAVAEAGLVWRQSKHKGKATLAGAEKRARNAVGKDHHGDRAGFISLLQAAASL